MLSNLPQPIHLFSSHRHLKVLYLYYNISIPHFQVFIVINIENGGIFYGRKKGKKKSKDKTSWKW